MACRALATVTASYPPVLLHRRRPCLAKQRHGGVVQPYRLPVTRQPLSVFAAQGQKQKGSAESRPTKAVKSTKLKPLPQDGKLKWGLLDWEAYNKPWEVPWGGKVIAAGMVSWAISFLAVGILLVPLLATVTGVKAFSDLASRDKALFALVDQVLETLVGVGIIQLCTRKFEPLSNDLFNLDSSQPFKRREGWLAWGLMGVLAAPVVVSLSSLLVEQVVGQELGGRGTVDGVVQIVSLDLTSYVSLLLVTAVLAPLLEEYVFRGFFLTSLTKYMPTYAAVLVSSVAFAAAHLSGKDFPQLAALGILLGFTYVRSRNLLTPMMIHGMWNGSVLTVLFLLDASGVDLEQAFASYIRTLP